MTVSDRIKKIFNLALPITIGLGSSYLMAFIDLVMVRTLGNKAIAALGLSSVSYGFFLCLITGVVPILAGMVARRRGENSTEPKCMPLNAALVLVLIFGIPLSILIYFFTPTYFSFITDDAEVAKDGISYFRVMVIAMVCFGMTGAFKSYWTGIERPKVYLLIVLFINCLNVFLNYIFIFGNLGAPELGTMGAGVASAISVFIGVIIYSIVTYINYPNEGFLSVKPSLAFLSWLYKMGIPVSLNGMFLAISTILMYWMIGKMGTAELAVITVLFQVAWLLSMFSMGLGEASAVLVSDALGKGDVQLAEQWGWDAGKIGFVLSSLIGIPLLLFPEWFILFLLPTPETVSMAVLPFQLLVGSLGVVGLSMLFAMTLFSIGEGKRVMITASGLDWFFCLPAIWIIGPYLNYGLLEVWIIQTITGLLASALIIGIWRQGRWKTMVL
jgi:MATE family multidrug resistance protein